MCPLGFSPRFSQGENICSGPQRTVLPHSQLYNRQEKAVYKLKNNNQHLQKCSGVSSGSVPGEELLQKGH